MKNKDLEALIYDMLTRQNRMMIGKIMPSLERMERVDDRQERDIGQLRAAVSELQQDVALLAGAIYKARTGRSIEDVRPH